MRRALSIIVIMALVFAMALPAMAVAKRGGVPASPGGKGRPAAAGSAAVADDADETEAAKGKGGKPEGTGKPEDAGKPEGTGKPAEDEKGGGRGAKEGTATAGDDAVRERARERVRSEETSGAPEPKRTGIANALSRLEANLARMQAELEAGERDHLPPGLQRAIAKFLSWLGLDDGDTTPEDPAPDDGSEEPTSTVEPTATVEPTVTVDPIVDTP